MFNGSNIITAIEVGTSKIVVLVGKTTADNGLTVIGRGEAATAGSVVKGEITEMQNVFELLNDALTKADVSSGHELNQTGEFVLALSACDIASFQGVGTVFIKSEEQRVTAEDIDEAIQNAQIKPLPLEQLQINSFDGYYLLDGVRRVSNPIDQVAHKLEAFVHVIHGNSNRIENFRSLLHDAGLGENIRLVFSGMADAYGVLSDDEKANGVLLVDFGAGTTEYVVIYNMGVLASGCFPIGFEHLANDLSLGLKLPFSVCRKMLADGTLANHFREGAGLIEVKNANGGVNHIPVASFERIVDLRLRELFELIKSRVSPSDLLRNIGCGGVITGGGAMFDRSGELFQEVFNFPVRSGCPYQAGGALTDLENPRYSTVWGALKYSAECQMVQEAREKRGLFSEMGRGFGRMVDCVWGAVTNVKKSVKL